MVPWYNTTNLTNSDTFVEILQYANETTTGMYGLMFIIGFFLVMFISFKAFDNQNAFVASSFITAIIAVLLRTLGLLNELSVLVTFLLLAGSFISLMWKKELG